MRLKLKMSAVASVIAVTALSIQGMSPATAADPEPTATPTPAATEDVDGPPAEDAEGLVDVTIGEKTAPLDVPAALVNANLVTVLWWDLGRTGYTSTGDLYGGSAVGVFIDADIAGLLSIKSRKLALSNVDKDGGSESHDVAGLDLGGFFIGATLEVSGIESDTRSTELRFSSSPSAQAHVRIARLKAETLLVEGLDVTAFAGLTNVDPTSRATAKVHVARLKSGSKEYQDYDVPPNTTYTVSGLGKVVLNEQKITELPGDRYAAKVNAVHITLSTASLGLPVGTNIYIGSTEAIYYQ
jgi:hypothetical protein